MIPSSLAVYRKTTLTPVHEAIHWVCLRFPSWFQRPFLSAVATLVLALERLLRLRQSRPDNVSIAAQVEDWFFLPKKGFFSIKVAGGSNREDSG